MIRSIYATRLPAWLPTNLSLPEDAVFNVVSDGMQGNSRAVYEVRLFIASKGDNCYHMRRFFSFVEVQSFLALVCIVFNHTFKGSSVMFHTDDHNVEPQDVLWQAEFWDMILSHSLWGEIWQFRSRKDYADFYQMFAEFGAPEPPLAFSVKVDGDTATVLDNEETPIISVSLAEMADALQLFHYPQLSRFGCEVDDHELVQAFDRKSARPGTPAVRAMVCR